MNQETVFGLFFVGSIMTIAFLSFLIKFLYFKEKKKNIRQFRIWKRFYKNKAKYEAHMSNKKIHKRLKKLEYEQKNTELEENEKNAKKGIKILAWLNFWS